MALAELPKKGGQAVPWKRIPPGRCPHLWRLRKAISTEEYLAETMQPSLPAASLRSAASHDDIVRSIKTHSAGFTNKVGSQRATSQYPTIRSWLGPPLTGSNMAPRKCNLYL